MHHPSGAHPAGRLEPNRTGERVEGVLLFVSFCCAILLLLAPAGERTYWEQMDYLDGWSRMYDGGRYELLAFLCGVVALVGLIWAVWQRPHRWPTALGATAAVIAFLLTAVVFGFYWWEASRGIFRSEGRVFAPEEWTVHPMTGYRLFAVAGVAGLTATLILATRWLRHARSA